MFESEVPSHIYRFKFPDGRKPVDVDILSAWLAIQTVDSRHGADDNEDWRCSEAYYADFANVLVEQFDFERSTPGEAEFVREKIFEAYEAIKKNGPPPPESPASTT